MPDKSKVTIESIKRYFLQLKENHSQLQEKCNLLQDQIDSLNEELKSRDEKIEQLTQELVQCEGRYKNLQISQKAELNNKQLQENRERFAKLVREIDKCISLLNNK